MSDPIDNIQWIEVEKLNANNWNPNRVHKAELRLLELSLLSTGWIQPILVNRNNIIIDGFHRWRLSNDSKKIREIYNGKVPVAVLDIDDATAKAVTVRINRAKGTHVAVEMHKLVHSLLTEHGWDRQHIAKEIGATLDEVDVLAQDGVFAAKNINQWAYSQAWYPAENGNNASKDS
jgi:ParB-like chromosome segregation protein Spo0J